MTNAADLIDDFLASTPQPGRAQLAELIALIRTAAPEASEKISYRMPTWYLNGNVVHAAAFTSHVGLYPGADGVAAFADELDGLGLAHSKGAIQFPLGRPLPADLIGRIVAFRVEQQRTKPAKRPRASR